MSFKTVYCETISTTIGCNKVLVNIKYLIYINDTKYKRYFVCMYVHVYCTSNTPYIDEVALYENASADLADVHIGYSLYMNHNVLKKTC
jgi:hypothetical protein